MALLLTYLIFQILKNYLQVYLLGENNKQTSL